MNRVAQNMFGEPVVYQPVVAGVASGAPFTVTAVRNLRLREEAGPVGNFEEIGVNPVDFMNQPVKGDWVTAWGQQYVVTAVRQPDPYGLVDLSLLMRAS